MKRILFIALLLLAVLTMQAQLISSSPSSTPQGLLKFDSVITGASFSDDTGVEPFIIEAELVDSGVLIRELRYKYVAYKKSCVQSMRLRIKRSAPDRVEYGLIKETIKGYNKVEIVEVAFLPDEDMTHWTATYTIGTIPPHERCEVEFIDSKCVLKKDYQHFLIKPDK